MLSFEKETIHAAMLLPDGRAVERPIEVRRNPVTGRACRNRNGYNLGLLSIEDGAGVLELRVVMAVRSNYAPWVRSDHTGFEVMLGDMATFSAPEETEERARPFWGV